jgi:hypothetical protein
MLDLGYFIIGISIFLFIIGLFINSIQYSSVYSASITPLYTKLTPNSTLKSKSLNSSLVDTGSQQTSEGTTTPFFRMTVNKNEDPLGILSYGLQLIPFLISGLAGGLALFLGNIGLDRHRRPSLSIDRKNLLEHVEVDLDLFKPQNFSQTLGVFKIKYKVYSITIRNGGRNAAENCKGILKINDREEKVCWHIPSETYKMTINVDSIEYLNVCAMLVDTQESVFKRLQEHVENLVPMFYIIFS